MLGTKTFLTSDLLYVHGKSASDSDFTTRVTLTFSRRVESETFTDDMETMQKAVRAVQKYEGATSAHIDNWKMTVNASVHHCTGYLCL